jgi:hypothetical protein
MRLYIPAIVILSVAGAVSACSGTPKTFNQTSPISDTQSYIGYGAAGRDLKVVVIGSPFGQPADEVLATEMDAAKVGPSAHLTTHPNSSAMEGFRIVLSFNGKDAEQTLCTAATPSATPSPSGAINLQAALCDKDKLITAVEGKLTGATQANDPAVAELMKETAVQLFPAQANWKS